MTPSKEQLLQNIKDEFSSRIDVKFRKGDEEHENNIMDIDAANEAMDELLDAFVYLYVLIKKR